MFTLPDLEYDYAALGTYISKDIMELHHSKHHQTYVDKLNAAIAQAPELKGKSLEELLSDLDTLPEAVKTAVRNHGGGEDQRRGLLDRLACHRHDLEGARRGGPPGGVEVNAR